MVVRGRTLARASGLRKSGLIAFALAATVASGALSGCSGSSSASDDDSSSSDDDSSGLFGLIEETANMSLTPSVEPGKRNVPVDTKVSVAAADGTIEKVLLYSGHSKKNAVAGSVSPDGTTWTAEENLDPGERYRMVMRGKDSDGDLTTKRSHFRTEDLDVATELTYLEYIQPYDNATVGVGMPVVLMFDVPVTDKASIERSLHVTSEPQVKGSWHWYSDTEVHYRPKHYWPVGTEVHVDADIHSVSAGNGVYGQTSESFDFTIGREVISKINLKSHKMKVYINDKLARTIPVTGGMPGYETRSGTKVIMEKYRTKDMDAATTGVSRNDPEYYNISNVPNALRVTWSGEFLHGAPWSEADQGYANVSHGCVGMSVANSAWMYDNFEIGDVVKVTGSSRSLEPGNGWTDWDVPWGQYAKGSALN
jgi:lipoprotein-anchoring transpeptidase ErfK/SrfK